MADEKPLRILGWDVENILRVVAVHIEPSGRVVELTGKNRNGKSSTIDALWMALGGKEMIPPEPIHDGAEIGTIIVDIGDDSGLKYKVTRKLKRKEDGDFATSLTVASADGARFEKPQQILDGLIGALSCDPLAFMAMKPEAQFDTLKKMVPGFDFDASARADKEDFDKRTIANREAKTRRTRAEGIDIGKAPLDRQDEAALVAELAGAADKNSLVQQHRNRISELRNKVAAAEASAETSRVRIAQLTAEIDALRIAAEKSDDEAAAAALEISDAGDEPPTVDTTELQAKITQARADNAAYDAAERAKAERTRLAEEAARFERESAALTKAMEERAVAKAKAISEAKIPVPGISFGDGVILLDGHPLSQASQAQKLSTAIAIAVALQPRLRFVTTKNAALLDDDSWEALVKLAEEQDLLIIAETVNSDRPSAVHIEDGYVRGAARQAAE